MKTKSVMQTVGPLGKDHDYLGHFKSEKVLNQGHNDGPSIDRAQKRIVELHMQLYDDKIKQEVEKRFNQSIHLKTQNKTDIINAREHLMNVKEQEGIEALEDTYRKGGR